MKPIALLSLLSLTGLSGLAALVLLAPGDTTQSNRQLISPEPLQGSAAQAPMEPGTLPAPATLSTDGAKPPEGPRLAFPVACVLGQDCEIQHYVDRDPGPGVRDYRCGLQTYEGHKGIDFRIPDMAAQRRGVEVLAAAPGRVARLRDGVADISVRAAGAPSVANQECGNGLAVDHGGGWETQYCHMARGSLRVREGQVVEAGAPLGQIGLSGNTEFPHLHMTLRHNGVVVDPFAPLGGPGCAAQVGMWTPQARAAMTYKTGAVLNAAFSPEPVTMAQVEAGDVAAPTGDAPYLVAYVRGIDLQPGDEIELGIKDPSGADLARSRLPPLDRWKAQHLAYVGKKRPPSGWPSGAYVADYKIWRSGKVAIARRFEIRL